MNVIKHRLTHLEEHIRDGRCQACGLRPQDHGYMVVDDNDPAGHIPGVCPECGRSTKVHIRVVYEGEEGGGASYEHL
jgi:hypothetical protein